MLLSRRIGNAAIVGVVAALLALAAWAVYSEARNGWGKHRAPSPAGTEEAQVRAAFLSDQPVLDRYEALFDYFARGFVRHAAPGFARIQYPGAGSGNSFELSGLEGFARTAPLLAARIYSQRGSTVPDPDTGRPIEIVTLLKTGLLSGVDPASSEYWGDIQDLDQRIVEAADIARILWLTRSQLWDSLTPNEKELITRWLMQATVARTFNSNWRLFPITVGVTLAKLDTSGAHAALASAARTRFAEYRRKFYLEHGWFMDEHVDFYNAWGITYELFWIHTIDPTFDAEFIAGALRESALLTEHLIGPQGIPIMGRSLCYRTAVPVPVVAETFFNPAPERAGHGLRALDAVWRYFVAHDSLRDGALTQGYFEPDMRYLDGYSGTGSCHWGLRSLVLAFMQRADAPFWSEPEARLPIEERDYRLEYARLGWTITGNKATSEIVIEIPANEDLPYVPQPHGWRARAVEMLTRAPDRPRNYPVKYDARYYSSSRPFPVYGTYSSSH